LNVSNITEIRGHDGSLPAGHEQIYFLILVARPMKMCAERVDIPDALPCLLFGFGVPDANLKAVPGVGMPPPV
jgi:hypothetical protein